jgi:hypothetical protein
MRRNRRALSPDPVPGPVQTATVCRYRRLEPVNEPSFLPPDCIAPFQLLDPPRASFRLFSPLLAISLSFSSSALFNLFRTVEVL